MKSGTLSGITEVMGNQLTPALLIPIFRPPREDPIVSRTRGILEQSSVRQGASGAPTFMNI
jgi:hypothetical protein